MPATAKDASKAPHHHPEHVLSLLSRSDAAALAAVLPRLRLRGGVIVPLDSVSGLVRVRRPKATLLVSAGILNDRSVPHALKGAGEAGCLRIIVLVNTRRFVDLAPVEALIDGVVFTDFAGARLARALTLALDGLVMVPPGLSADMEANAIRRSRLDRLNDFEVSVIALIARGMANADIARRTGEAEARVKQAVKKICEVLALRNRTEAAVFYNLSVKGVANHQGMPRIRA